MRSIIFIFASVLVSLFVMGIVFPDLLIHHRLGFQSSHDPAIPYYNCFSLISQYYHGGIQLWNRYDQMNYAYSHLTTGLYTLANLMTAAAYILFSPFFKYPGEMFHSFYSVGFYTFTTLIRTIGGYLLLRIFCRNYLVIFISLIYLNTLLSSQMYLGLLTNNLYSYFPLLIYFILRFFEKFRLNDFLSALLVMTIAVANSALMALGYFYLAVHFFVVICILGTLFGRGIRHINLASIKKGITTRNILKIIFVFGLCVAIMFPYLQITKSLSADFYIAGSGLGDTRGRLDNMFSVSRYFEMPWHGADPKDFLLKSIDFWKNEWWQTWMFLGLSTLFLSYMGIVFSKDRRKHLFLLTIILILLANTPKNPTSLTSLAHWLNALTNPFSFLLRGFHMTALLLPYLFLPLIVLGLNSCIELIRKEPQTIYCNRAPIGILLWIFLLICGLSISKVFLPYPSLGYFIFTAILSVLLLYILWKFEKFRVLIMLLILFMLFSVDLAALSVYMKNEPYSRQEIVPRKIQGQDGLFILDYQNPKIFPFKEYFRYEPIPEMLRGVNYCQTNYCLFYSFTHIGKYFYEPHLYYPRHISYKNMHADSEIKKYLYRNKSLFSLVDFVVSPAATSISELLKENLDKRVVIVENKGKNLPRFLNKLPDKETLKDSYSLPHSLKFSFPFHNARRSRIGNFIEYSFELPDNFPDYLSTGIFTEDRYSLMASMGNKELRPVQGKLIQTFTYDVQNVRTGNLTILLSEDFDVSEQAAILEVKPPSNILDIWRNEHDNLGFKYLASRDGWLVFHFPYDKKWRMSIDGEPCELFRANRYFIGTPIQKGEHEIFIQYWPDTRLREMIAVSMVFITFSFIGVIILGIRNESPFYSR